MSSHLADGEKSLIGSWIEFAHMLGALQSKAKDLELSNFSVTYGAGTEASFRAGLREIATLVNKMVLLAGPETSETMKTIVS